MDFWLLYGIVFMKYIMLIILGLILSGVIFIYGVKVGKSIVEKKNAENVINATSDVKDDTVALKKELLTLKAKLDRTGECEYILKYPVKRCIK